MQQYTIEKNQLGEMLIEHIIEIELWGLGPLAVHVLLKLVIFIAKQKFLRNIFKWITSLFASILLQEAM